MRAWQVTTHGTPTEALELVEVTEPEPGPGEILVRVAASVANFNEVDACHGRYLTVDPPLPYVLGMECVGEVVGTGPGAEEWLGRRVTATGNGATGAHAEVVAGPAAMAFEAPPMLDDVAAAAFFYPFHLAHLGLFDRGRLAAGETVLVHAAAGGVGSAAVQLAKAAGARVVASVGGEAKARVVAELGADVVVDHTQADVVDAVLDATEGTGADVVFDGVGLLDPSLRCLAGGGRHLVVGFAGGIEAEEVPMVTGRMLCFGNFDVLGVILAYVPDEWATGVALPTPMPVPRFNPPPRSQGDAVQAHLLELLAAGAIHPVVGAVRPFEELPAALEDMEARRTTGRVVIAR